MKIEEKVRAGAVLADSLDLLSRQADPTCLPSISSQETDSSQLFCRSLLLGRLKPHYLPSFSVRLGLHATNLFIPSRFAKFLSTHS